MDGCPKAIYTGVDTTSAFHHFARSLYADCGATLLTREVADARFEYACAVFEIPEREQRGAELDSILGPLTDPGTDPVISLPEYADLMIQITQQEETPRADRPKFALSEITSCEPLRFSCHVSSYRSLLATCQYLRLELEKAWIDSAGAIARLPDPLRALPYRQRLHQAVSDPLRSGHRRSPGLGISTLICYRDKDAYRCMLNRRSEVMVAEGRGRFHVIPAGGFESAGCDLPERTYSVKENLLRKYLEELFPVPEPIGGVDRFWYRKHESNEVPKLEQLIEDEGASLHLTGLAVNLLELRPEICTLLLLKDEAWAEAWLPRLRPNWQYEHVSENAKPYAVQVELLDNDELIRNYGKVLAPSEMVVQGAAAFWLGVELARKLT